MIYTIKRLSRNGFESDDLNQVHQNYLHTVKTAIPDDPLIIVDESDIIKPYAEKMEHLSLVRDGSKNVIEKGYTTINFSMATPKTKHPIPLYNHLYSSREELFQSQNFEIAKGFNTVHSFLGGKKATFVMDRGYDSNAMFQYVHNIGHFFVTRLMDTRYLLHRNRRIKVPDLAKRRKGKINFRTEIQGKEYNLKVSHIKVELPVLKGAPLNMIVVYGYGEKPMKLLTNHAVKSKEDVLRILKGYITRWRIEELFRVQKEEFHFGENPNDDVKLDANLVYHHELHHWSLFPFHRKKHLPHTGRPCTCPPLQCVGKNKVLSLSIHPRGQQDSFL
ncbi:MAG: hypothetical protein LRY37_05090 [Alkalibacterium thalassium]|nr:hypothetical protein [Alkalibacterium thalassium]